MGVHMEHTMVRLDMKGYQGGGGKEVAILGCRNPCIGVQRQQVKTQ